MHDAANDISLELLEAHREPITGPIADVQSHAFSTSIAINPLIAAAMPLINHATEIEHLDDADNISLSHHLQHEVKAFENAAHKNGYRSQMILAARYLLCTVLDEFISVYQPQLDWHEQGLLNTFQHETWGGERFFVILERSCEDPATYIDLLELGYICLSLGYKGKYNQPNKHRELGIFIDQLYQLIEQQRGEKQNILSSHTETKPPSRWHLPPWWVTAIGCVLILSSIFIPYVYQLNKAIQPLTYNIDHYGTTHES